MLECPAGGADAFDAPRTFTAGRAVHALRTRGPAGDAGTIEAVAETTVGVGRTGDPVVLARNADVLHAESGAAGMAVITGIAHRPAGDTGTTETIGTAALCGVRALGAIASAVRADALEALAVTTVTIAGAGSAGIETCPARAVDAEGLTVEEAAFGADRAGAAGRLALAETIDTGADAAVGITGAGGSVRSTGVRQHLRAGQAPGIAGVSQTTLVVGLTRIWIGALGTSRAVAPQEQTEPAAKCLQDTATRRP
jgi:hypothetical protein